jgi:photosystem II stability/assembly factor-like uncharacterized protein
LNAPALRQDGFQFIGSGKEDVCLDVTADDMRRAIREFVKMLQTHPGAIACVYHAGHGVQTRRSGHNMNLLSISCHRDGKRAWVVDPHDSQAALVLTRSDGGRTWNPRWLPRFSPLQSVHFGRSGGRGWAVGLHGTMMATADGGQHSGCGQRSGPDRDGGWGGQSGVS